MTLDVTSPARIAGMSDEKISTLLLAAGGDIKLVQERINYKLGNGNTEGPSNGYVTEADILEAFLANASTSAQVQDSIKALMLLNYLQILNECRGQLSSSLPEFSPSEILKTVQMIITGMADLLPEAPVQNNTQVNLLQQFSADTARERVFAKLDTYAKVDEKYGTASDGPSQ